MNRLVRAELSKAATTRLTYGLVVAVAGLTLLLTALALTVSSDGNAAQFGNQAAEYATEPRLLALLNITAVVALFALVLGISATSGEFRHRTIVSSVLAVPVRGRLVASKLVAYTFLGAVMALLAELAVLLMVSGWLVLSGVPVNLSASVALMVLRVAVVGGLAAAIGVGVGTAVHSQLAAVLVGVGWVLLIEQMVGGLVPAALRWLPFGGALGGITAAHSDQLFGPAAAAALAIGYAALVAVVGAARFRRADIG